MNVVILDTGCANLNSVKSAVSRHGYEPQVSRDPDVVLRADKLFLPGVGTAQAAMDQLRERDLIELIKACTQPVLGICLGMQLLAHVRLEDLRHQAVDGTADGGDLLQDGGAVCFLFQGALQGAGLPLDAPDPCQQLLLVVNRV